MGSVKGSWWKISIFKCSQLLLFQPPPSESEICPVIAVSLDNRWRGRRKNANIFLISLLLFNICPNAEILGFVFMADEVVGSLVSVCCTCGSLLVCFTAGVTAPWFTQREASSESAPQGMLSICDKVYTSLW